MTEPTRVGSRGVMPVLALVILIGVVAIASIGILVFGVSSLGSTSDSLDDEYVEQTFTQVASELNTVAVSSSDTRSVALGLEDADGDVELVDSGNITVRVIGGEDPLVDERLQSIEYRDDESVVAYESGAVFRGEGQETRVVSAPQIEYTDGGLQLPITRLGGVESLSNDQLTLSKTQSSVLLQQPSSIDGRMAVVTIESPYYAGWADYFEGELGANTVSVDHEDETTTVVLGHPRPDGSYEDAIVAVGNVTERGGNPTIDGSVTATGNISGWDQDSENHTEYADVDLRPIDGEIEYLIESADDAPPVDDGPLTNGTYRTENVSLKDEEVEIDLSDGDVTILADGYMALRGATISVTGDEDNDHVARVYLTGDVAIGNGESGVTVSSGEAERFQLYGTSEMMFALGQDASFTGTVYAPRNEPATGTNYPVEKYDMNNADCSPTAEWADVCFGTGDPEFAGSIVSGPMSIGQSATLSYDPQLEGTEPTIALDEERLPPELRTLEVRIHDVSVDSE